MEFNEYLKSRFPEYYKKKSEGFGLKLHPEEREKRAQKQNLERKNIRTKALLERRKIQEISMEETKPEPEVKKPSRKSLLRIWKHEKQIKLEAEKLKKKPVFKIPSAANVGFPELKAIYPNEKSMAPKDFKFKPPKNIKPIYFMNNVKVESKNSVKPEVIKRVTRSQKPQASPPLPLPIRKTRKVLTEDGMNSRKNDSSSKQPAKNIKKSGSQTITSSTKKDVSETVKENGENVEKILSVRVTPLEMLENKNEAVVKTPSSTRRRSLRNKPVEEPKLNETFDLSSSQTDDVNKNDSLKNKSFDSQKTPENLTPVNTRRSLVYISPFVSTSRGKGSVKKENKEREARGLPSYTKHNTPDEESNRIIQTVGAQYFHNALENEISRLLVLCDTWNSYKENEDLPEEAKDLIDVATGQAHLLMNKKFQQFRGLINACQSGDSEQVVTCEDLQGFWDMVYIQVENLNLRFNKLTEMKNNNWEEVIPEVKKKVTKKRAPAKTTKAKASSNLRAAIQAARKKTRNQAEENEEKNTVSVFDGGFFTVKSPNKNTVNIDINTAAITPDIGRRSLRISVVTSEARKTLPTSKNSPGLAVMRVSQCAKDLEKSNCNSEYVGPTPGKSILKSAHKSSENRRLTRTSKVVLFKEDTED